MIKKYPKNIINNLNYKIIKEMFNEINIKIKQNDEIIIKKIYKSNKPIIQISVNNNRIYAFLINRNNMIIYNNKITSFIKMLASLKNNKEIYKYLYYFHYSDNTFNNSGKERYSFVDFIKGKKDKIIMINKFLNSKDILSKIIDNVLFKDDNISLMISFVIYYDEDIKYIKSNTLKEYMLKDNNISDDKIHISKLILNNKKRNINFKKEYESKRLYLTISFYDIYDYLKKVVETNK